MSVADKLTRRFDVHRAIAREIADQHPNLTIAEFEAMLARVAPRLQPPYDRMVVITQLLRDVRPWATAAPSDTGSSSADSAPGGAVLL